MAASWNESLWWCDGTTIASSNKKRLYRACLHSRIQVTVLASRNKMKLLPNNTFMWSFDTASTGSKPLQTQCALGEDWLHPSVWKNWQLLVYLNENWKREKKLNCVHWDFWRFWLAWSGNVLKFSFKLRPAVCQNLIDIFHVLRNIQFNSDIK